MNSDATLPGISRLEPGIFHLLGLATTRLSHTNMVKLALKNKQTSKQSFGRGGQLIYPRCPTIWDTWEAGTNVEDLNNKFV